MQPSTRRGPREHRDAARRRRLLQTGLEVFGTVGYARSAIEAICAEAGVGTRSFYEVFASKEDLLLGVYDQVVATLRERLVAALEAERDDLERHVRAGVGATVQQSTGDERAARVQLIEVIGVSERVERHRRDVLHAFAELLRHDAQRLHADGLAARPLSAMRAMALVGGTNEVLIDWLLAGRRPPRSRMVEELTGLWLAALR